MINVLINSEKMVHELWPFVNWCILPCQQKKKKKKPKNVGARTLILYDLIASGK